MMSHKIIVVVFLLLIAAGTASAQNRICPFEIMYRFGDGISDIGNAIRIPPVGPLLPPTRDPYGVTFPGSYWPLVRWPPRGRLRGYDEMFPNIIGHILQLIVNSTTF